MEPLLLMLTSVGCAYVVFEFYLSPRRWPEQIQQTKLRAAALYIRALFITLLFAGITSLFIGVSIQLALACITLFFASLIIPLVGAYLPLSAAYLFGQQIIHLAVLMVLLVDLTNHWEGFTQKLLQLVDAGGLLVVLAYLLVLKPSSWLLALLLKRWTPSVPSSQPTLDSAGQTIGMVERSLVLTCVLINQFAAIGFIVAAKSIFRFGDLTGNSDRKLTEYVMLGTLLSVAISVFVGLAVKALIGK
ncbi:MULTISPECIES: DUF3307 domain-containing protein [unclassified Agarivorans]|uniref:DUF3307 domain-containing protein n=1 Tax=unclassified Agarivorans TaxID=2636026 RepID=UPI003D7D44C2